MTNNCCFMTNTYTCTINMERRVAQKQTFTQNREAKTNGEEILESKGITADDWKKMSLVNKWKASYNQEYADKKTSKYASYLGCCTMLYTVTSIEYVAISFMAEELLSEYSPMNRYYLRVLTTFIFIQVMANWLCTVCYQSDMRATRDNPDIDKLLWDEHPTESDNNTGGVITAEDSHSNKNGLSWQWCDICEMNQPPRTHHCKICQKCILKRDHHCFFTGTCIGYYNQRHFVILVFYLAAAAFIYMPFFFRYMQLYYTPGSDWIDYFLPSLIYNWVLGGTELKWVILVSHYYTVWWGGIMAVAFFATQMYAISKGLTSHEMYKRTIIRSTASIGENFRDVFGACWMLNFIFPTVILFEQPGNGKHWVEIKKV